MGRLSGTLLSLYVCFLEKNGEKKVATKGGGKKEDGANTMTTAVLRLDLHCESCAKKVERVVSHFQGVEKVEAECETNELTVTGNVDPTWLRERVEKKTKTTVELISSTRNQPFLDGEDKDEADDDKTDSEIIPPKKDEEEEGEEKKADDLVGTMDEKELTPDFEIIPPKKDEEDGGGEKKADEKVVGGRRGGDKKVAVAAKKPKPAGGGGDKKVAVAAKEPKPDGGGEKKAAKKGGGAGEARKRGRGEKKAAEKFGDGGGDKKKDVAAAKEPREARESGGEGTTELEVKEFEYKSSCSPQTHFAMAPMYNQMSYANQDYGLETHHPYNYAYHGYPQTGFVSHYEGPPPPPPPEPCSDHQLFSDENPNGCSVM